MKYLYNCYEEKEIRSDKLVDDQSESCNQVGYPFPRISSIL